METKGSDQVANATGQAAGSDTDPEVLRRIELASAGDVQSAVWLGAQFEFKNKPQEALKWWLAAANQGDAKAQNAVGFAYFLGNGVDRDPKQAVAWYRKAASQNNAQAQNNLGICFERGEGVEMHVQQAVVWYRSAADQGLADAQFNLGQCLFHARGVASADEKQALELIHKAAAQVYPPAIEWLLEFSRAPAELLELVTTMRNAMEGDRDSAHALADCFASGRGMPNAQADPVRAMIWFSKAASAGDTKAAMKLAECFERGVSGQRDEAQATEWLRRSAESRHPPACLKLGQSFLFGLLGVKQQDDAVFWLREAMRLGEAQALRTLQDLAGKNVPLARLAVAEAQEDALCGLAKDEKKAFETVSQLAASGLPAAMFRLGRMLSTGAGASVQEAEAQRWFEKANTAGSAAAALVLAHAAIAKARAVNDRALDLLTVIRSATLPPQVAICSASDARFLKGCTHALGELERCGFELLGAPTVEPADVEEFLEPAAHFGAPNAQLFMGVSRYSTEWLGRAADAQPLAKIGLAILNLQAKTRGPAGQQAQRNALDFLCRSIYDANNALSEAALLAYSVSRQDWSAQVVNTLAVGREHVYDTVDVNVASILLFCALHGHQLAVASDPVRLLFANRLLGPFLAPSLHKLVQLNLSQSRLSRLPPLFGIESLRSLNLSGNTCADLSALSVCASSLETLDLAENGLSDLPRGVTALTGLRHLSLRQNRFTAVPADLLGTFPHLEILNMCANQLSVIPLELLATPSHLLELHVSDNKLTELPAVTVVGCPNLSALSLAHNAFTALPRWLAQFAKLSVLDLAENKFVLVPSVVYRLPSLALLDMSGNDLADVPFELGRLPELKELRVEENKRMPAVLLERSLSRQLLGFLREAVNTRESSKALKLITLGNSMSGKTLLVNAIQKAGSLSWLDMKMFNEKNLAFVKDRTKSLGITPEWNDGGLTWQVRDTPGQVEYSATNALFLNMDSSVALVCVSLIDGRDECTRLLTQWLSTVAATRMSSNRAHVIVAGTFDDDRRVSNDTRRWFDELRPKLIAAFPTIAFELVTRVAAADPRSAKPIRDRLVEVGNTLSVEQPKSLLAMRAKAREWAKQSAVIREDELITRLTGAFGPECTAARDYLDSTGDLIHLPHLKQAILNVELLALLVSLPTAPAIAGYDGVWALDGVVSFDNVRKAFAAIKRDNPRVITVSEAEFFAALQNLDVMFPVDSKKPQGSLLVPGRLGAGKLPLEMQQASDAFRKPWREAQSKKVAALLAAGNKPAILSRRFRIASESRLDASGGPAAATGSADGWAQVLPPGFLSFLVSAVRRLDLTGGSGLRCNSRDFALSFALPSGKQAEALIGIDAQNRSFDVTVVSEDAQAAMWALRDCLDPLAGSKSRLFPALQLLPRVLCCRCFCESGTAAAAKEACPERTEEEIAAIVASVAPNTVHKCQGDGGDVILADCLTAPRPELKALATGEPFLESKGAVSANLLSSPRASTALASPLKERKERVVDLHRVSAEDALIAHCVFQTADRAMNPEELPLAPAARKTVFEDHALQREVHASRVVAGGTPFLYTLRVLVGLGVGAPAGAQLASVKLLDKVVFSSAHVSDRPAKANSAIATGTAAVVPINVECAAPRVTESTAAGGLFTFDLDFVVPTYSVALKSVTKSKRLIVAAATIHFSCTFVDNSGAAAADSKSPTAGAAGAKTLTTTGRRDVYLYFRDNGWKENYAQARALNKKKWEELPEWARFVAKCSPAHVGKIV